MVLAESVLLLVLGGVLGLALASVVIPAVSAGSGGMLNLPAVGASSWVLGIVLMVAIGVLVGALPAWTRDAAEHRRRACRRAAEALTIHEDPRAW